MNKVAPDVKPSSLIGSLAFWFLFLGAVAIAVSQLGIAALDNFVAAIGAYIPNIIAAVLIFVIAGVVAAADRRARRADDGRHARPARSSARSSPCSSWRSRRS